MSTFVLIHGAWHGGWAWQRVIPSLRAAGHEVHAPTLTGLSERAHTLHPGVGLSTHIQDIVNVLEFEDLKDIVLVGHSYGGGVALHIAARRPQRIASLTLYEPSAFHLLKEMGVEGRKAHAEVVDVARGMREALDAGAPDRGAACFIDYWNGTGAWPSMKPALREEILAYLPKGPLDYAALEAENTSSAVYAGFGFPVMIMRGGRSPRPVRLIAGHLLRQIPAALSFDLLEAGHMGPITHAAEVAERFARHIENACVFFHGYSHAAA
jgi:pimeloyl-ACP methyl ester carboxylesterase